MKVTIEQLAKAAGVEKAAVYRDAALLRKMLREEKERSITPN